MACRPITRSRTRLKVKALADPAYFQGNVDYYLKNRGQSTVIDDDGNVIGVQPGGGRSDAADDQHQRPDGSVLYDINFRSRTTDQVLADAAAASQTFNSVHMEGFDGIEPLQEQASSPLSGYARSQGTTVILVLSPWHPYLYDSLLTEADKHAGFFAVEPWLRQYCAQNDVPLYGSYDPALIGGLAEEDFFDGLHCRDTGTFFPRGAGRSLRDRRRRFARPAGPDAPHGSPRSRRPSTPRRCRRHDRRDGRRRGGLRRGLTNVLAARRRALCLPRWNGNEILRFLRFGVLTGVRKPVML